MWFSMDELPAATQGVARRRAALHVSELCRVWTRRDGIVGTGGLLSEIKRRRSTRHAAHNLHPSGGSHSMGDSMRSNDRAVSPPFAQTQPDTIYTELETRLLEAVADFGIDDLSQMLDVATAIRRARRL